MMEGPRNQHLHQEWQGPLEERGVILGALRNIITDARTVLGADPRYCADAAVFPGNGALWGAMRKNEARLDHTHCTTRPGVAWATLLTSSLA